MIAFGYSKKSNRVPQVIGRNTYLKSHPYQARLAKKYGHEEAQYPHAEIMCLIHAAKLKIELNKIIVFREYKNGKIEKIQPCPICQKILEDMKIKF